MSLTPAQMLQVDDIRRRNPDYGDRRIAEALGVTHWQIRQDRKNRVEAVHIHAPEPDPNSPVIGFYDIETAPKVGLYWGPNYQTNIAKQVAGTEILSFAYRYEGEESSHVVGAWQDPEWEPGILKRDRDEWLMQRLWAFFDSVDVVVAHNGDKFDQKKANARFLRYGMTPPSPYIEVDTLKLSRTFFGLDSHKLDDLAAHLGLEGKVSHSGIDLWEGVMLGNHKDQEKMLVYNARDTDLLAEVFPLLEPWVGFNGRGRKFNRLLWLPEMELRCPNCLSWDLAANGYRPTGTAKKQSYICNQCGARPTQRTIANKKGVSLV